MDQTRKEGEFTGELKQLRRLKHDQKTTLADLRRETNSNSCYFADIQVGDNERKSLKQKAEYFANAAKTQKCASRDVSHA